MGPKKLLALLTIAALAACATPSPAPGLTPQSPAPPSSIPATVTPSPTGTMPLTPTPQDGVAFRYPPQQLIHDIIWSPDGQRLAVSAGTNIYIYDDGQLVQTLSVGVWSERIAFHPTRPILAAAGRDGQIRFWDLNQGGKTVCSFRAHERGAKSLAFGSDTLLATTGNDIISHLWDISSVLKGGCEVSSSALLIGNSFVASDLVFNSGGRQFALIDLHDIRLRETATRKLIATLHSDQSIFDLAMDPQGRWLAAAQGGATVALWDLTIRPRPTATIIPLPGGEPKTYVWRVDFSPDGQFLAGGASDGQLVVWDLATLKPVLRRKLPSTLSALAFKPNSHRLAAGTLGGALYFLEIEP